MVKLSNIDQSAVIKRLGSIGLRTAEFELKSPGYPTDAYADDLSCRYRVMKSSPSVCELMITILDFKLQEGEVCENDYLQIAEERLCGTIESGMTRMYPFGDADEILMNFDSDGSMGDKGFHISGQQKECNSTMDPSSNSTDKQRKAQAAFDCDRTITGAEDSIRSPGFPDMYPANVDCRWMVLKADSRYCELEITINNLHIQVGESCQFDFLEVDGHRFCGSIFSFKSEQIVIHFHSDDTVSDRGFEVNLKQRDCPTTTTTASPVSSCDQVFDSKHFILVSPNHPRDYDNGVDCSLVQSRHPETMAPRKGLNLDEIANLFRDITENESDDGQLSCSILNSDEDIRLSETFSIIPSRPWGIVVSDADCGALARFESRIRHGCLRCNPSLLSDVCFTLTSMWSTLWSTGYVIRRSSEDVCRLEMEFLRFDVESSSNCEYDYLAINGEKICGLIENTTRTYLFQDYEKQLTFHSDSGTSRPGFMIRVKQVDCSVVTTEPPLPPSKPCDQSFSSSVFEIRSDNHPDNYDPHLRCVYTVSKAHPGVCAIELTFLTFDVEASDGCQYDYLKLQEERLCGIYPSNLKREWTFSLQIRST
ncbi:cubilin [Trichonephila clavipes]|nr:cubilin [Trichonephila clavipes]